MDTFVECYQKLLLALSGFALAVIGLVVIARGLNHLGFLQKLCWLFRMLGCPRSWVAWVCIVPLACFLLVMGSEKTGGGSSTNSPSLSAPLRLLHYIQQVISSNDVARGYRISENVGTGGIVPMPAGTVTNELLRSRGGYDWAFRVEPDGWRFPCRDGFLDGVTVLARGEVRPDIGTLFFPVPITNGVSLLPEAKWGQLPHAEARRHGEGSVFWHGTTGDGSLLLTWENALVGRDLNAPTNMQMELYRDGSFTWRTDDTSQFYMPVFPFDWDNDGLENSVDPEPLVANSVDAHGTNAEWYDIVCSNVFTRVEEPGAVPLQTIAGDEIYFRMNANDRAYYFVDAVAELGPAPIFFTADGLSDLGDPVVVALAGVTNRVPLLLGATYSVTSTVPFSVYTPTNEVVEVTTNSPCDYVVRRPISITYNNDGDGEDGYFSVGDDGRLDGSVYSTGECCCDLAAAGFPCGMGDNCPCNGCTNTYYYGYCGYSLPLGTWGCGCNPVNPPPPTTPDGASFSISFSDKVVIFEDAYDNTPSNRVNRSSTETTIVIYAQGGQHGGMYTLTTCQNLDKLCSPNGTAVALQISDVVGAGQSYVRSYVCQGISASGMENDIEIAGKFVEADTNEELSDNDKATVVRVELKAKNTPSANPSPNRHLFGVFEKVELKHHPLSASVTWEMSGGGNTSTSEEGFVGENWGGSGWMLRCPLYAKDVGLKAKCGGVEWPFDVTVLEPSGLRVPRPTYFFPYPLNVSAAGMKAKMYVQPESVNFEEISFQEVPVENETPMNGGCFTNLPYYYQTHTVIMGAGDWGSPDKDNYLGEDKVTCIPQPPFHPGVGWQRLRLPWGWHKKVDEYLSRENSDIWYDEDLGCYRGGSCFKEVAIQYDSYDEVYEDDSVSASRYGWECLRMVNGLYFLNGELVDDD